jgi:mRNA-degrading endonuclease RelE of RelBE toxin-antitoxin system
MSVRITAGNHETSREEFAMYEIEFTPEAKDDLTAFRKFEQQTIIAGIETQLRYEPTVETRNRKRLRPNNVAEWELRLGKYRVFYNVEEHILIVSIEAIGFKVGNVLFIRGKRREL